VSAAPEEVDVTVTSLEIHPGQLRPAPPPALDVAIRPVRHPVPALNRFLYTAVGGHLHWVDRLGWTHADWMAWLDRDDVETWVAYDEGTPLGYVELERQDGGDVEIAYFGVLPEFRGRRIGGHLLSFAVERGLVLGERVWVHTCTLDGPAALPTYLGRGFRPLSEVVERQRLHPDPGPWPGAKAPPDR
jgi:GNAT superfamily N-acetyltransferase